MYSENSFSFGRRSEKPTPPKEEVTAESVQPFEFNPDQARDLEAGPLNIDWLVGGLSNPALSLLTPEAIQDMRTYAEGMGRNTPETLAARRELSSRIRKAVEVAGDAYLDQQEA